MTSEPNTQLLYRHTLKAINIWSFIEATGKDSTGISSLCHQGVMHSDAANKADMERGSSVVECRTRNQVSPGSNPSLLPFRRLGIFFLSIDAPVHSAV